MSARRNLVFLLPLGLFMGIAVTACGLVAGLRDNVEIETGSGGAGASGGGGAGASGGGGTGGAGGMAPPPLLHVQDSLEVPCSDGMQSVPCDMIPAGYKGQDADYDLDAPDLEVSPNNSDIVIDNRTKLRWWVAPQHTENHAQAEMYCALQGPTWRLPTRRDFLTILDFSAKSDLLVDKAFFPKLKADRHWTSTTHVHPSQSGSHWAVNLCSSCDPPTTMGSFSDSGSNTGAETICVEGPETPSSSFVVTQQSVDLLRDQRTGLIWYRQITPSGGISWMEALQYCESLTVAMTSDWRLPTALELATIIDDTTADLRMTADLFDFGNLSPVNEPYLWSSTPSVAGNTFYALLTSSGSIHLQNVDYHFATCVRGPN